MGEIQVGLCLFQVRLHLDDATQEFNRILFPLEINSVGFPPLNQPLQQLRAIQRDQLRLRVIVMPDPGRPAYERPVTSREQFLLVRSTHRQIGHIVQRLDAVAGARANDMNFNPELMQSRQLLVFNKSSGHPQRGTGGI